MTYRGHLQNGTVVLDDPLNLPEGTEVLVEPMSGSKDEMLAIAQRVYQGLSQDEMDEIESIALDRQRFFDHG